MLTASQIAQCRCYIWFEMYFALVKKYVPYNMNVCSMKGIQTYYIRHAAIVMSCDQRCQLCRFTAIYNSSPVASWERSCSSDLHFRISPVTYYSFHVFIYIFYFFASSLRKYFSESILTDEYFVNHFQCIIQ